jgi:glycerol-3-phosphate dehydrogenase (NAD(P)+)
MKRLSVVGGGAWGVALATAAHSAGSDVLLYSRRPHGDLPDAVKTTHDLGALAAHAWTILLAVPSKNVRDLARELGDHLDGRHILVHGIRGLVPRPSTDPSWEGEELATIAHVLREETPARKFGALGGPVLTDELAKGQPSVLVAASHYPEVLESVKSLLGGTNVRIYTTDDLTGLEWASALVSILAIAMGFARGAGVGAGLVSAFAIRGVHESARIAHAAGAQERTFLGLGGFGDLLAAMSQDARPEVRLGEALAKGASIESVLAELGQRIEAVELAPRVKEFAERHKVAAPIVSTIADGILGRKSVPELLQRLMTAPISGYA